MVYDPISEARARGARSNRAGRFEAVDRAIEPDGWDIPEPPPDWRTEVRNETARKIITRNTSPDIFFDRSVNPYRGCEHGCVYCYARPTHEYLGMSSGLDFETRLIAKPNAPERLAAELSAKGYSVEPIAIGSNTDPYQPIERDRRIMRGCLTVLRDFRHPVTITTRGALIERDLDILSEMAALGLVHVAVSVTTLDPGLARRMEPRAPAPKRRLAMISALAGAGVPVRVNASPMIPGLTDHELEAILEAAAEAGASAASWILLRLPYEVATLFREWLAEHAPMRAARVMARVRETHGGRDYDPEWHKRQRGEGHHAQLLDHRFRLACRRFGLSGELPALRRDLFAVPIRPGDQLSLF